MKQILSNNIAIISAEETMIINHPTMIFTDDNVPIELCTDEADLNYKIARLTTAIQLPAVGQWCEKDRVYNYTVDKNVKCLQGHSRMNFTPEQTPALFLVIPKVSATEYPIWKQPTGAHDAYKKGDRVHFPLISSPVYESLIDANVWSPTVYPAGWKKL